MNTSRNNKNTKLRRKSCLSFYSATTAFFGIAQIVQLYVIFNFESDRQEKSYVADVFVPHSPHKIINDKIQLNDAEQKSIQMKTVHEIQETNNNINEKLSRAKKREDSERLRKATSTIIPNKLKKHPTFLIIGAQKAGTSAIAAYLKDHPNIIQAGRKKELHFYLTKEYDEAISKLMKPQIFSPQSEDENDVYTNEDAHEDINRARETYAQNFRFDDIGHPGLESFDATPAYLFMSHLVPQRAKVISPWAQIIAILRNPVDRAYSQFNMHTKGPSAKFYTTFEAAIKEDIGYMVRAGLVPRDCWNFDSIEIGEIYYNRNDSNICHQHSMRHTAAEEEDLWAKYFNSLPRITNMGVIGRGLYAVQLQQWLKYFPIENNNGANNNTKSTTLVLKTELMQSPTNTRASYQRIVKHVNLPDFEFTFNHRFQTGKYSGGEMNNNTRSMLEKFFEPYNRRLHSLLGEEW
eukprot:CAMPEP_0194424860 /NCGR_PEP_ID=MMETSP0176-20130528/24159_1 /TAXON_ID=216777 /ORGANISM="Proboscia alata, Strain PI-D3" /LENGTH=462 /DNA_ID=CAMNT_0039234875 /DNA_START=48 /DNA_END=1433 /DNA_ORIENTATION=+